MAVELNPNDILDEMLEGCQVIGSDWRYIYINQAAARQGQKTKQEVLGQTMMAAYPGIEKTEMFERLQHCMKKRQLNIMENQFTLPDGSKGWFELRMEPVPKGVLIFSLDITARRQAQEQLEKLNLLKDKFIEVISHEMQTPLSEIRVSLNMILDDRLGGLNDSQKQFVTSADKSSSEAINRVQDMIGLLDIERGSLVIQKEAGQFSELIELILKDHAGDAEAKQIKVEFAPLKGAPISMDSAKMRQAIDKLIENAIMYTPKGGKITVKLSKTEDKYRMEISDTGIGIPAGEHSNIFQRFQRASNASLVSPDGAGIGLALAKSIIEKHQGNIGFKSAEGKGSTFWIELPERA